MLQGTLREPGKITLEEKDTPAPSRGEILVKVEAALTCGTDLKAFLRGHPIIPMPGPFGHEFSGTVAAAGAGVTSFKEGDPIMAVHSAPCLKCPYCRKKLYNLCEEIIRTKVLGAFAEYILLPAHVVKQNAFKKPKKLSFPEAALLEPLSCVIHGIEPVLVRRNDTVLILGSGAIGLLHIMVLKRKGARVAVADINASRLRKARKAGADRVIDASKNDPQVLIHEMTAEGIGFDSVFECTGNPAVWENTVTYLRRGGTAVLFGGCPSGTMVTYDTHRLHYDEITLRGDFHYTPDDVKKAYFLLSTGKINTPALISGSYRLRNLDKAFEKLSQGKGIKYAIIP